MYINIDYLKFESLFAMSAPQQLQTVNAERAGSVSLPTDKIERNQNIIGNLEAKKQVKFLDSAKHKDLVDLIDDEDYVDRAAKVLVAVRQRKKGNAITKKMAYILQNYSLDYEGAVKMAADIRNHEEHKERVGIFDILAGTNPEKVVD